jgi:hypothetical protein
MVIVVDKVALGLVFCEYVGLRPLVLLHQLSILIHSSVTDVMCNLNNWQRPQIAHLVN